MVVGGWNSGVWLDGSIGWRWDLLGRGRGICVCSGLFGGTGSKKEGVGRNCHK